MSDLDSRICFVGFSPDPDLRKKISSIVREIEALFPPGTRVELFVVNANSVVESLLRIKTSSRSMEIHCKHSHIYSVLEDLRTRAQHHSRIL